MAHARKSFFFARRHTEALGRYRDWATFGIMNADLAMLEIVLFLDDHAAWVESQKTSLHFFEIVDLQADMMQTGFHAHLAQAWPPSEER